MLQAALAATFVVDDGRALVDASPGDGACRTSQGTCTLLAALDEADVTFVPDQIDLGPYEVVVGTPRVVLHPVTIFGDGRDRAGITFSGTSLFVAEAGVIDLRDLAVHGGAAAEAVVAGDGNDLFLERVDVDGCGGVLVDLVTLVQGDPIGHLWARDTTLGEGCGVEVIDPAGVTSPSYVLDLDGVAFTDASVSLTSARPFRIANSRFDGGDGIDVIGTELGELDHVVFRRVDRALEIDEGRVDAFHVLFAEGAHGAAQVVGDAELWCDTCVFYGNGGEPSVDVPPFAVGAMVALDRNVFLLNRVDGDGGGLRVRGGAGTAVRVRNTVFADNRAGGSGGAVAIDTRGATVLLEHLSVGRNVADADDVGGGSGGGVYVAASSTTQPGLGWSAIAENRRGTANTTRDECVGALTRVGPNLVSALESTCVVSGGVEHKGTKANPLAPRWQNQRLANGLWGPVPRRGSPLLDRATGSPALADLGMRPRPMDGDGNGTYVADLGAVERGGPQAP